MALFLIRRKDMPGYDEYGAYIVRAASEVQARALVPCADECPKTPCLGHDCIWKQESFATCSVITPDGPDEVILSDFRAG